MGDQQVESEKPVAPGAMSDGDDVKFANPQRNSGEGVQEQMSSPEQLASTEQSAAAATHLATDTLSASPSDPDSSRITPLLSRFRSSPSSMRTSPRSPRNSLREALELQELITEESKTQPAHEHARDLKQILLQAIKRDAAHVVRMVLAGLPALATTAELVHRAAQGSGTDCLAALLESRADVDQEAFSDKNKTPLYIAAKAGNVEHLKLLLEYGANTEAALSDGTRALYAATQNLRPECLEELIAHGADVNAGKDGRTPIFWAALNNDPSCLLPLICAEADLHQRGVLPQSWVTTVRKGLDAPTPRHADVQADTDSVNELDGVSANAMDDRFTMNSSQSLTEAELREWLHRHGLKTDDWGRKGETKEKTKSVGDLLKEVKAGESILTVEGGRVMRTLRVVEVCAYH